MVVSLDLLLMFSLSFGRCFSEMFFGICVFWYVPVSCCFTSISEKVPTVCSDMVDVELQVLGGCEATFSLGFWAVGPTASGHYSPRKIHISCKQQGASGAQSWGRPLLLKSKINKNKSSRKVTYMINLYNVGH